MNATIPHRDLNIYTASEQWRKRPADERFPSIRSAYMAAKDLFHHSEEKSVSDLGSLGVFPQYGGTDLLIGDGSEEGNLVLTNSGFRQLAGMVSAPYGYLQTLSKETAAASLSEGLKQLSNGAKLLVTTVSDMDESWPILRAVTTERYQRVWHYQPLEWLMKLPPEWRVPPARPVEGQIGRPATEADVLNGAAHSLSIKVGDLIADAGIYLGHGAPELFVFMVNESNPIESPQGQMLSKGFFLSNDEGSQRRAWKLTWFYYNRMCGNHIIWGASGVQEISIRHIGTAPDRALKALEGALSDDLDLPASEIEDRMVGASQHLLGPDKATVVELIYRKGYVGLTKKTLEATYDLSLQREDWYGTPGSAWSMSNSLSEFSQTVPYTDQRVLLDRVAGQILDIQ